MSAILEALVPHVHPAISRQENFSAMPLKTLCSSCHLNAACLPCGMAACDLQRIDGLNFGRRRVKVGQTLYREGDRFQFIYAVRSGTFKSKVCAIPYAHLTELAAGNPGMQHLLSRLMSREIVREHSLMVLLGSMNAEERLAAFLLNLSQRLKARGYSPTEFHLRMSRAEIGSYLGMTLETVSRTFSTFQQQRILEVDKRHIRVIDLDGLSHAFGVRVR